MADIKQIAAVAGVSAYQLGTHAAETLLKRIARQLTTPPKRIVLKTELIIRESCASPRLNTVMVGSIPPR
ncbi:MAG: hypothetical protein ACLQVL_02050 [Terriglobia bacterium]